MSARTAAIVAAALLAAGCAPGTGSPTTGLAPRDYTNDPPDPGTTVYVSGSLIETGGTAEICSEVLESYPPQCGGALTILDVPEDVWQHDDAGVRWMDSFWIVEAEAVSATEIRFVALGTRLG